MPEGEQMFIKGHVAEMSGVFDRSVRKEWGDAILPVAYVISADTALRRLLPRHTEHAQTNQ